LQKGLPGYYLAIAGERQAKDSLLGRSLSGALASAGAEIPGSIGAHVVRRSALLSA